MDQTGAFAGPLLVAAVVAVAGGIWAGMAVLAVPGAIAMALLVWIRARVPDPAVYDGSLNDADDSNPQSRRGWFADARGAGLPREFFVYAVAASLMTGGLVTFGIISYHLTVAGLVPVATVPIIYAGAMLAEALAAVVVGWLYDRVSAKVLYAVPVLVALVPGLALSGSLGLVLGGVAVWGLAFGLQDSTIKALVADLVEAPRRATAYGVFAAIQGIAAIGGGVLAGWLYETSVTALVIVVAGTQVLALMLLLRTLRRTHPLPFRSH
jgi:MFS family permease